MKKTAIIASAAFLLLTASANAQTDTVPAQSEAPVATTQTVKKDQWNNWDTSTYRMLPMPEPLTTEKIFPVLGNYELTSAEGTNSTVTVTLDPESKGIVWIEGLPEGRMKAVLVQSPATYKIPKQKLGEEKDAKSISEGVLIYDRDANVLNVCLGCNYDKENPAVAFLPQDQVVADETEKKETKKKTKSKVASVKKTHYTGSKTIETTAAATQAPLQ